MDRDSKRMISYPIGYGSGATGREVMFDLASRLATRIQPTTDGHGAYLKAVTNAFLCDVDHAMPIKHDGDPTGTNGHQRNQSPARSTDATIGKIFGNPTMKARKGRWFRW